MRPEPTEREAPESARLSAAAPEDPSVALSKRLRPVIGLTWIAWSMYAAVGVVLRSWPIVAINVAGSLGAGTFYVVLPRRPRLAAAAAHTLCGVAMLCVFLAAMVSGHTSSPALWYLTIIPVAMGYLIGRRQAAYWSAACVLVAVAVEVVRRVHPIEPLFQPEPGLTVFNLAMLIGIVLALVNTAMRLNEQHVRELEQREKTIRNLVTGLQKQKGTILRARDQAIAASRAKSEFVATVSHEIRTPLNGVLGMAGLLLDEDLTQRQRELVGTIRLSGDALLAIINDILDFSKIEADKLELETAPFDLREHVEDAVDLFSATAAKKGLELLAVVAEGTPERVLGDGARFRQVLVNLLGNAMKFTDQGEVCVHVSARALKAAEAGAGAAKVAGEGEGAASAGEGEGMFEIACAVHDTGIGIPADRVPTLFSPFSQVDPSTTRKFGGTGLGLAISQRLAVAMGGGLSVASVHGEGSTFTFTLRAEEQRASGEGLPPNVASMRVGLLCALPGTRGMLESLARSLPMRHVSWPDEVNACAAGLPCDVLVCEDRMYDDPVRKAVALARIPVVLLTRASFALRDPWPPGVVRTLPKPVRRAELRRALLSALGSSVTESAPVQSRLPNIAAELPMRVLVAEDNPINQRVALLLLERLGYRADVAGNGAEAIDALTARPYDLVLMDVRMPEMDGIAATRRVRAELPRDRQPRVVAMTANATVADRDACRVAGMDDFLSKPIRPADLIRVLRGAKAPVRTTPHPDNPFDPAAFEALREIIGPAPGALLEMIRQYLGTGAELIAGVAEALSRKDAEAVRHAAHSLKGASAQMGARHVAGAALCIERAAAAGDLDGAAGHLPALRATAKAAEPLLLKACEEGR